jgi:hypothetical protein
MALVGCKVVSGVDGLSLHLSAFLNWKVDVEGAGTHTPSRHEITLTVNISKLFSEGRPFNCHFVFGIKQTSKFLSDRKGYEVDPFGLNLNHIPSAALSPLRRLQ